MSYNKTILEGHLTRDIELKYTQGGSAIASTAIAVSRKWNDQNNQPQEEVCFVDITFFGKLGEVANQFLRKGSHILVDGRLKLDQWTAQDGSKRSKHSVVGESMQMLDPKPQTTQAPNQNGGYQAPNQNGGQQAPNQNANQGGYQAPNQGGYQAPNAQPNNNNNPNNGYNSPR